ncbi:ImmA/IrrE family metallo-endopeptidase [Robbsia andropogonis]|uniref:ImmA/IrrE family metallo-endopeptidase n=1 Tax=Robbsia andropogonis TaxID=28092 RepID=UPI00046497C1|nr:ImmA/IrrE family metallo-endopeptidase [Robbsia andropogonis]
MRAETEFSPMWATPPGRTISDLMRRRGFSTESLARSIALSEEDMLSLLQGDCLLTEALAAALEAKLGGSAGFWMRREEQFRRQLSELAEEVDPDNDDYKKWLSSLPLKQMQELGWIEPTANRYETIRSCLSFFDVPNLSVWKEEYADTKSSVAFRTTDTFSEDSVATAAWLRLGELAAREIQCAAWDPERFRSVLPEIRKLTTVASPAEFLPKLQELCAGTGVAVVVVKGPKGCRASGATFFNGPDKAVLMLSVRYLSDDQFWFSFFHEAGHLILHWDADLLILETSDGPMSVRENEANQFASEQLVPPVLQERMPDASKSLKGIMRLAQQAGVSYGIIVGQMQFRKLLSHKTHNTLKIRYKWNQG